MTSPITFKFEDPFVNGAKDDVTEHVNSLINMGFYGDTSIDLDRRRPGNIDFANPATQRLIDEIPSVKDWLDLVPTAAALEPCYDPTMKTYASGKPISDEFRQWFANSSDGRGIRSRAAVFRQVAMYDALSRSTRSSWLSLACGAARPAISAVAAVREAGGPEPLISLVDVDPGSLDLARQYSAQHGVTSVITRRMNVLERRGVVPAIPLAGLWPTMPANSYDMVEAIGLLEYLNVDDWQYKYNKVIKTSRRMAGARTFLRNAYRLVKPGGLLVVGNMLTSHPQLGFTLNVIQWPHIQPRGVDEMLILMDEAGVHGDRQIYLPSDGVYTIYTVRKPLE